MVGSIGGRKKKQERKVAIHQKHRKDALLLQNRVCWEVNMSIFDYFSLLVNRAVQLFLYFCILSNKTSSPLDLWAAAGNIDCLSVHRVLLHASWQLSVIVSYLCWVFIIFFYFLSIAFIVNACLICSLIERKPVWRGKGRVKKKPGKLSTFCG